MSRTYHLSCPEAALYLWIGQSPNDRREMTTLYSGPPYTDRLHRFLLVTAGKPLTLIDSEREHDDAVEFEPED